MKILSKLYTRYLELKRKNPDKIYLLKSGLFYIFIAEDAVEMSQLLELKCIPLTGNVMKCGFPENSKEKYLDKIMDYGREIEIVEFCIKKTTKTFESSEISYIGFLNKLKTLNLNAITPIEALEYLYVIQKELLSISSKEQ